MTHQQVDDEDHDQQPTETEPAIITRPWAKIGAASEENEQQQDDED